MPVPSSISDLSSTASSNYPSGSESIGTSLDDYLRAHASIIKQVSDAKADTSHTHTASNITDSTSAGRTLLTAADAAAQRTALGLTSAATAIIGTSANNLVQLDGSAKLPAVDGSLLTGITAKQIQPITASVAANALTITLNPTTLDFRSSTFGSGTVNTRNVSSPVSVTVSSGSTLGTVSGQLNRLVVIAIDNAGTVELAVANIAGGVQLDETTLISTTAEGGAGAADSATAIYSTTSRTSVPYRVVGFVESTQATAGTWATSPSTIQGAGGLVLAGMNSLGYGQTWQNVTGSRSVGTTYYNTTGKPILVFISGNSTAFSAMTVAGVSFPFTTNTSDVGAGTFLIPAGSSYVVSNMSIVTNWNELR